MKITRMLMTAALCCAPAVLPAVTIVSDVFADGDRSTQNLPGSLQWWTSSLVEPANLNASVGSMTLDNFGGSGTTLISYFAPSGSPVSLQVGQALQVSITFAISGPLSGANNFRVGLFDSSGSTADPQRISADAFNNNNAAFAGGYPGYAMFTNTGGANNFQLHERTDPVYQYLMSRTTPFTSLATMTPPAAMAGGTLYTGTLTVARTGAERMDLSFAFTGGELSGYSLSASDISGITSSFDTLSVFANSNIGTALTISEVTVEVIPEPSTYLLVFGIVGLCMVALKRRRVYCSAN